MRSKMKNFMIQQYKEQLMLLASDKTYFNFTM